MEYGSFIDFAYPVGLSIATALAVLLILASRLTRHWGLVVAAVAHVGGVCIDFYQGLIHYDLIAYTVESTTPATASSDVAVPDAPTMLSDLPWFAVAEPLLGWLVSLGLCAFFISVAFNRKWRAA
jgi:hypothetical protein